MSSSDSGSESDGPPTEFKKSKHSPMEVSSKKKTPRIRKVVETQKKPAARDPRFESLAGQMNNELFTRSYGFMNNLREKSISDVKSEMNAISQAMKRMEANWGALDEVEQDKYYAYQERQSALQRQMQQEQSRLVTQKSKERDTKALQQWKRTEREARSQGKGAFYLTAKAKKDLLLKSQFEALSADKKQLRKSLEKRRKKIDQQEKKKMPLQRRA